VTVRSPAASDERPHPPVGSGWWEVWSFDLVDAAAGLGFHLDLEIVRDAESGVDRSAVRAALVGDGRPLVSLVADDLPRPRVGLEVRGPGIWAAAECETPLDHWSLGLEAFAVALDDPWDALGAARGDRTPLGADLEWEAGSPPVGLPGPGGGYEVPSTVHGEVLVGSERLVLDGVGVWAHRWGPVPTSAWGRHRAAGSVSRPARCGDRPVRIADLRGGAPDGRVVVTVDGSPLDLDLVAVAPAPTTRGPAVRALVREVGVPDSWGWLLAGGDSVASS
jgi:hypothetical protein